MILYQQSDGLIVASGMGPDDTLDNHIPEAGLGYSVGPFGQLGQYYDASTGLVSDSAPQVTATVDPTVTPAS